MEKFTHLTSVAAPLPQDDIDTDIIYPARFLLITERKGLGRYAFHDWRTQHGDFALDRAPWSRARILVTGANFGCGSSREQAPWALADLGIRAIIAPGFGEIFAGNCYRNGMLPITLDPDGHTLMMDEARAARPLEIDLASQTITTSDGHQVSFPIEPQRRDGLLNGWDEVDMIRAAHAADIQLFEDAQARQQPWLWTEPAA